MWIIGERPADRPDVRVLRQLGRLRGKMAAMALTQESPGRNLRVLGIECHWILKTVKQTPMDASRQELEVAKSLPSRPLRWNGPHSLRFTKSDSKTPTFSANHNPFKSTL